MKTAAGRPASLAQYYLRRLIALFLALVLVILAPVLGFVFLPLSERSADDLAGLMVLSVQTWAELPPETRSAFESELLRHHHLALQPAAPRPADASLVHGFYIGFLDQSLPQRSGKPAVLVRAPGPQGVDWFWTTVAAGDQAIGIGFSHERMTMRPLLALGVSLLAGITIAALAALWLARRIAQPVACLEQAAAELAHGARPALLAQTGPRELADLAGHFNQMALQVRELLDARTTLLAGLSHDLRTPLARMRLAVALLTLKPRPALIERLEQDIEEMNLLIGQLLDLARGMNPEYRQTLDLASWLAARASMHADTARTAKATITVRCTPALQVQAAAGMLGRVLDNLLGNALRYAPGPIELTAQAITTTPSGGVRISVLDRGPGIDADQIGAVWRPFHRVEASRNPQTGGYGLGLAIVRQLASAQGWQVGLAARDGGGLQAWVELTDVLPRAGQAVAGAGADADASAMARQDMASGC